MSGTHNKPKSQARRDTGIRNYELSMIYEGFEEDIRVQAAGP